jgi:hypothetical protein
MKSKKHINKMSGKVPFQCVTCEKVLSCAASLSKHKKIHLEDRQMNLKYHCKLCNMSFRDKYNLKVHSTSTNHYKKRDETIEDELSQLRTYESIKKGTEYTQTTKKKLQKEAEKGQAIKINVKRSPKYKTRKTKELEPEEKETFDKDKFIEYLHLSDIEMIELIDEFIKFVEDNNTDPNDYIDIDYYKAHPEEDIADTYNPIRDTILNIDYYNEIISN